MNSGNRHGNERRASQMKGNLNLLSLAVTLVMVVLVVLGLSYAAPFRYYSRTAIVAVVFLVVLRMVTRRRKGQKSKAAEPDPQSRLNLDE